MFMKTEKRRKHKGFAIAIGALAMYGAYSVIKALRICVWAEYRLWRAVLAK